MELPCSFLRVTDDSGAIIAPEWLPHAEPVHRQLRGVMRHGAHRFYFREGFFIASYCFRKNLG